MSAGSHLASLSLLSQGDPSPQNGPAYIQIGSSLLNLFKNKNKKQKPKKKKTSQREKWGGGLWWVTQGSNPDSPVLDPCFEVTPTLWDPEFPRP